MTTDLATRSYWLGLDSYEPDAPFEGEMRADVVIVGGGFCGLWTAYHLLKADPGMTVVVIEGSAVGYGASGRNGGFAMTLIHKGLKELVATLGADRAKALHLAAEGAIHSLRSVCETESIDADLQPNGLLTVSNTPFQDAIVRDEVETAENLGPRLLRDPMVRLSTAFSQRQDDSGGSGKPPWMFRVACPPARRAPGAAPENLKGRRNPLDKQLDKVEVSILLEGPAGPCLAPFRGRQGTHLRGKRKRERFPRAGRANLHPGDCASDPVWLYGAFLTGGSGIRPVSKLDEADRA